MNNSWWQELLRFFLQGMTLKQLIHMLIILVALVIISPTDFKEWVNIRNPEIIPPYWMYYTLLFCGSYIINGILRSSYDLITERLSENRARRERDNASRALAAIFDSLSLKEKAMLAFAVDANNGITVRRGDETAISLAGKGLLSLDGRSLTQPRKEKLSIPKEIYHECFIRFSGKSDTLDDELINDERTKEIN
ncbi:super-infection exclusion protein B [Yersinia pekkanenii]|uniref:Superinfection exclusion protein B n=1 Tax=Yersinia pekkanenii TaxID=1288385 RepID=A0A0T9RHQ7_9GAMM|nr:super-infection exclusion protein B [Yersinia pekkanenii]CNI63354.1 Uncharacterised protein [Yersinia pekkanenii]CRY69821.1 Uncharacterised protein [Yersinia pekkanenii]